MNKNYFSILIVTFFLSLMTLGCGSQDVPQAHKGRMFDSTGAFALWTGGNGFEGPILNAGTYYTGLYDEVRMVDCSQSTVKEKLTALTKDSVQFGIDIYLRYSANCQSDEATKFLLNNLSPIGLVTPGKTPASDPALTITTEQIYNTYLRPSIGEAVRESTSPYIANDINANREKIFTEIQTSFKESVAEQNPNLVVVFELSLNNLDFPETLDKANVARAEQAILKDKAIAERDKVDAEIVTAAKQKTLSKAQGTVEAARIDEIGAALRRNPEYLDYQLNKMLPEIYKTAGSKGNLIIAAPTPLMITTPMKNPTSTK